MKKRTIWCEDLEGWFAPGLCSLGGKGGGGVQYVQTPPTTTTNKTEPWDAAQPFLKDIMNRAQTAANATPTTPFAGNLLAPVSQPQLAANAIKTGTAASAMPTLANFSSTGMQQALDTASGKYLDPSTNPALVPGLEATIRPMMQGLTKQVLPQLTSDAWNAGAYGGARHGLREADVINETGRTISDTIAKAVLENYQRERGLQFAAPGLAQQSLGVGLLPADVMSGAGAESRAWGQEGLDAEMAKYNMGVSAPWQAVSPYAAIVQGLGIPTSSTITGSGIQAINQPSMGSSIFGGALGGASAAGGLASAFPSTLGFLGGPWGLAGGAILGGLLGMF